MMMKTDEDRNDDWGSQRAMVMCWRSRGLVGVQGFGQQCQSLGGWSEQSQGSGREIDLGLDGILAIGWGSQQLNKLRTNPFSQ